MSGVTQRWLSLMAATVMLGTTVTAVALAHITPVIGKFVDREVAHWKASDSVYLYDGGYVDDTDYVLLDLLPGANHSKGGVFFIGDSQSRNALMPWHLSPAEQELIHNYSIGDLHHRDQRLFVQMLVEEMGLLDAGPQNTTVILGISPNMARPRDYHVSSYVSSSFERHGLFTYTFDEGMHRGKVSDLERSWRVARDYASRFVNIALGLRKSRVRPLNPQQQTLEFNTEADDWREAMDAEIVELTKLVDYLRARHVRVRAVIRPSASWKKRLPYERTYLQLVTPILAARDVPLIDQSNLLTDSDFVDDNHVKYPVQLRLHEIDRDIALRELSEMGLTLQAPPPPASSRSRN
ncbi:MAG: hypothetical protein ABL956_05260 [Hyphomonadaceae bacterium]